jgi:hypothetical protein
VPSRNSRAHCPASAAPFHNGMPWLGFRANCRLINPAVIPFVPQDTRTLNRASPRRISDCDFQNGASRVSSARPVKESRFISFGNRYFRHVIGFREAKQLTGRKLHLPTNMNGETAVFQKMREERRKLLVKRIIMSGLTNDP